MWVGFCLGFVLALFASSTATADGRGISSRLLVLNMHDDSLMVFDLPSHRLSATISVGHEPHEVAVMPDGSKAYISNAGDGSLTVIDLHSLSVLRTLTPERLATPHGLGISHDGRYLLVTSEGSRRFYQFETKRDVLIRAITSMEEGMRMIAMPRKGWNAYATNRHSNSITQLDAKRLNIETHIQVGPGPEGIVLTPDGRRLLVALRDAGEVVIMKAGSEGIEARVATGQSPVRIAVTPDGSLALVSNQDSDDLTVIDLNAQTSSGAIAVGKGPGGLAIAPDGHHVYVANTGSNTVSVVSVDDLRVTGTLEAGAHPDGMAIAPLASRDQD